MNIMVTMDFFNIKFNVNFEIMFFNLFKKNYTILRLEDIFRLKQSFSIHLTLSKKYEKLKSRDI